VLSAGLPPRGGGAAADLQSGGRDADSREVDVSVQSPRVLVSDDDPDIRDLVEGRAA
jgi:hypothetical protein